MSWPTTVEDVAARWSVYLLGTPPAGTAIDHAMLSRFRAYDGRNAGAARSAERFLTDDALDDKTTHTRVFVVDGEVVGYYSLSVGEAMVTSKQRKQLRARTGTNRIPTAHVDWIARDTRAPSGTGVKVLKHAVAVVTDDLQPVTPIVALSLDPFDAETAKAWCDIGLKPTSTELATGQRRLFLPLTGYGTTGLKQLSRD